MSKFEFYLSRVKRICVFEHSVMTNFNCACPAVQRGQGSGFLSEGSSRVTACMSEQRRFWRDCADAQARLNLRCSHRRQVPNSLDAVHFVIWTKKDESICSESYPYLFDLRKSGIFFILHFTASWSKCRVVTRKRIPVRHHRADYMFWSFGINKFRLAKRSVNGRERILKI